MNKFGVSPLVASAFRMNLATLPYFRASMASGMQVEVAAGRKELNSTPWGSQSETSVTRLRQRWKRETNDSEKAEWVTVKNKLKNGCKEKTLGVLEYLCFYVDTGHCFSKQSRCLFDRLVIFDQWTRRQTRLFWWIASLEHPNLQLHHLDYSLDRAVVGVHLFWKRMVLKKMMMIKCMDKSRVVWTSPSRRVCLRNSWDTCSRCHTPPK